MNKHKQKVAEIIEDVRTCMLVTMRNDGSMRSRPMATAEYDDQGNIWFYTDDESAKLDELENKHSIVLTYAKPSDNTYLSITGTAVEVDDIAKKRELFTPMTKIWFPDGPDSDGLTMIKFSPETAEYWDSTDSNFIQLYRIGKAILTGNPYETNEDEHAKINMTR